MPESAVSARASRVALVLILLVAAGRVVSTWLVLSQTVDESTHIAAGMEWLSRGSYGGEPQHPPLARVAGAIGPYAAGARLPSDEIGMAEQGNEILHSGPYLRMLSLARTGILPFFLLSIVVVWWYARTLAGDLAATAAALLYANLPPVLAHAGLATTDMAVTAGIAATLMLLQRLLLAPTCRNAALLGLALAVAVTSKFSSLLFIPVAAAVIVAANIADRRVAWRRVIGHAALALLVCIVSVWAVYRFRFEPLHGGTRHLVSAYAPALAARLEGVPLPMPELLAGVAQMLIHNEDGHESYLLGEYRLGGWWYYFPVAIAVKTTIAFLLLALGSVAMLWRRREYRLVAPFLAAAAIVVACFPADINIGIRHVLPIYPLLAVSAGCVVAMLWQKGRAGRVVVVIALAAELFVSARAHPDYLPYFNAFAGDEPRRILLDSNLDWGQDLLRLERRARELKIPALRLSYFGTADIERHDLPFLLPVSYEQPSPGWFAVSEGHIGSREHPQIFPWLSRYPYERIGRSIRLYRVPGAPSPGEILGQLARVLVPLPLATSTAADGRRWTTELYLTNHTPVSEPVLDHRGNRRDIAPGQTLRWDVPSGDSAWFLYVGRGAASRLSGQLVVSAPGTRATVPLAHEQRFRPRAVIRLSACRACSRTLRVYSLSSGPMTVDMTVAGDGGTWTHSTPIVADTGLPAWGQFDLNQLFPAAHDNVHGELSIVTREREPLWAFVTTGHSLVTSD